MFFILSKVLHFLVMPFSVAMIILICGVIIRNARWKKRLLWTGFVMLLFFSNDFIANAVMEAWEVDPIPYKDMRKYKLGIVLTGATIYGLQPNDRVYFHRGADRVTHTVQLYQLGLIEKILISGGIGRIGSQEEPEALKFRKVMLMMGVPDSVLLVESETRNTGESAIEVKKILAAGGYEAKDCLLITSAFHMRRSQLSYEANGLELDAFSTDFYGRAESGSFDDFFIPQTDALMKWNKIAKEWVGIAAYRITGYI